jgi:hypothetical protein
MGAANGLEYIIDTAKSASDMGILNIQFYFADSVSQSCVTTCPLRNLTWGDKFTLKCEKICSRQQYRDNGTNLCSYSCSAPFFADNTTWNCVRQCPINLFSNA